MSTEEKFRAAVNVIRSLPKNGSYQPSYDLQLRFYGYFKQGSEGPCTESQPAFWEVVRRKKWEAWKKLGNMPKEQAMESYVEELKKIVETMSYNENVAEFLGSLGSFYEAVPQEDLQMAVGDIIEKVSSRGSSPTHSTTSPSRKLALSQAAADIDEEDDEDDFKDSLARQEDEEILQRTSVKKNGHAVQPAENAAELATRIALTNHTNLDQQVAEQLRDTIRQLQKDFDRMSTKVRKLEEKSSQTKEVRPSRGIWPLSDVSPRTAAIIILWPLVVHGAVAIWRSRRRR